MNRISLSRLTDLLRCLGRAPGCFIGFEIQNRIRSWKQS